MGRNSFQNLHKFQQREGGRQGGKPKGEELSEEKICLWARTKRNRNSSWDEFSLEDNTGKPVYWALKVCGPQHSFLTSGPSISVVSLWIETFSLGHARTEVYHHTPVLGPPRGFLVLFACPTEFHSHGHVWYRNVLEKGLDQSSQVRFTFMSP